MTTTRGTAASNVRVYSRCGRCRTASPAPYSTMRPHRHAVGDVLDDADVVGDEEVGQSEFALQGLEPVQDLRLHADIQRRGRLVADDHLGLHRQRAGDGDGDALALAAAEFVRDQGPP